MRPYIHIKELAWVSTNLYVTGNSKHANIVIRHASVFHTLTNEIVFHTEVR